MTDREEIELLRRELADLRTRVAKLEAEKAMVSLAPMFAPAPAPNPFMPQPVIGLGHMTLCSCPPNTVCGNAACPRRGVVVAGGTAGR